MGQYVDVPPYHVPIILKMTIPPETIIAVVQNIHSWKMSELLRMHKYLSTESGQRTTDNS